MIRCFLSTIFWGNLVFYITILVLILPPLSIFYRNKEKLWFAGVSFFSKLLLLFSMVPVEIIGKENLKEIDMEKGLIIAVNHASFLDFFVLQAKLPLPLRFVVWWSGFRVPLLKNFYRGIGYIGAGESNKNALSSYLLYKALKEKGKLVVFSRPAMQDEAGVAFSPGILRLAFSSKTPILPVAIKNSSRVLPLGKFLLDRGKIKIGLDKPSSFKSLQDLQDRISRIYQKL